MATLIRALTNARTNINLPAFRIHYEWHGEGETVEVLDEHLPHIRQYYTVFGLEEVLPFTAPQVPMPSSTVQEPFPVVSTTADEPLLPLVETAEMVEELLVSLAEPPEDGVTPDPLQGSGEGPEESIEVERRAVRPRNVRKRSTDS